LRTRLATRHHHQHGCHGDKGNRSLFPIHLTTSFEKILEKHSYTCVQEHSGAFPLKREEPGGSVAPSQNAKAVLQKVGIGNKANDRSPIVFTSIAVSLESLYLSAWPVQPRRQTESESNRS
jgi:hypothetical protein